MGYMDTIQSMKIVAIILCPELLTLGLYQSIHNLTIPFRLKDILVALSISSKNNGIGLSII